jgi:hypothetical protein
MKWEDELNFGGVGVAGPQKVDVAPRFSPPSRTGVHPDPGGQCC